MNLSATSITRLSGVHVDLVRVVREAAIATPLEFIVTEGVRTLMRQGELVKAGASQTMKSRHLTGHAVDLAAVINGDVRWDWPLYDRLGAIMKAAALRVDVAIEWGGDWKTFRDGPHFQLPYSKYPERTTP